MLQVLADALKSFFKTVKQILLQLLDNKKTVSEIFDKSSL